MDVQICLEIFDIRILKHESIIQMQQMRITCHHGGCKQNLGGGRPSLFKLPKVAPTVGAIYQAGGQYRSHAYGLSGKPHMHTKNWFLLYTSIYKITLPTYWASAPFVPYHQVLPCLDLILEWRDGDSLSVILFTAIVLAQLQFVLFIFGARVFPLWLKLRLYRHSLRAWIFAIRLGQSKRLLETTLVSGRTIPDNHPRARSSKARCIIQITSNFATAPSINNHPLRAIHMRPRGRQSTCNKLLRLWLLY